MMIAPIRLLVATTNPGKIREVRLLVEGLPLEIVGLEHYPDFPDTPEPYTTFAENAAHKALVAAQYADCLALADDSGLEVTALAGRPGVLSSRYAADDTARIARLLDAMQDVPEAKRQARFVCAVALSAPDRVIGEWLGTCEGIITRKPVGSDGFGFDPVFAYDGRTFAQMTAEHKNAVSHRGRALRAMRADLEGILTQIL